VGANSSEGSDGRICEWNGRRAAIVDFGSAGQHKFSGLPLPRLWRFENAGIQNRAFAIRDMTPSACAGLTRPSLLSVKPRKYSDKGFSPNAKVVEPEHPSRFSVEVLPSTDASREAAERADESCSDEERNLCCSRVPRMPPFPLRV
jgi:hypothetical protein